MAQEYRMEHTCIRVMDLEESIEFYKNALGFEVTSKNDFPEGEFTLAFLKDKQENFELELTYNYDREEPYTIGDGYSHLAVKVDDLEKSHQRHKELGYEVSDLSGIGGSTSSFYFLTDPDGYDIEVVRS